jgi:cysteine-S-conjugate beta-lyase
MHPATELVRFDAAPGDPNAPCTTPIYQTATFAQPDPLLGGEYDYTRSGNPTRSVLETQLAKLEGATRAFSFTTGMAALSLLTRLVPAGGRILCGDDIYGGTWRLLERIVGPSGIQVTSVDPANLDLLESELGLGADLLILETPSNPRLRTCDVRAVATRCRAHGCRLAVDNSLLTPLRQRPLALGADIVMHSATKFLGGHADLSAGVLAVNDPQLAERIGFLQNAEGTALAPFDAWLLLRGLKTLHLRLAQQELNAQALAEVLRAHPLVSRTRTAGSLVCFETGSVETSAAILRALDCFTIAVSFGSTASTASLPCRMSHASIPAEERRARDLPEDLVRLSAGIEFTDDLVQDLRAALDRVAAAIGVKAGARGLRRFEH